MGDSPTQPGGAWPSLRVDDWSSTRETLHMWLQIVGKLRLAGTPMINHWWQATFYVTPRGLTTGSIFDATRSYRVDLDFHDHELRIDADDGARATVTLEPKSVHVFWGAMDMAVTRFSGRPAPRHPGGAPNCGDWVMVEGYSHELSSCGFWAGGGEEGAFYAYAYPEPDGFKDHEVTPDEASYSSELRQFLLPCEAVRTAADPDATLLGFPQTTYEAAAVHAAWDRLALEYAPVQGARPG